ncbi:MAG: ABC transporter ATP-binding protein [Candidatus Hydrogenedentes bacterium]|nr:ABC transporter ATP-binding protein [Candidatus Hydrogenedentota bacterium]
MNAIETSQLTKIYSGLGKKATRSLDHLSLSVQEGEIFGFLGRNGAGKTTTIKLLCSLLKPTSGEAFLFGQNARTRESRRLLGYLPEQPYFYEFLTPRETLDFYGKLRGLGSSERTRQWERLSELLDLKDIAHQRIKSFSKGMRQRIGFAVALVGDPPLLILDEPMSGLDPVGRRTIRELILRCRDEKKTIFFSSHVLADVELICDRVGILVRGQLTQCGRVDTLLGGHVDQVELVVRGIRAETQATLREQAEQHRILEDVEVFVLGSRAAANDAIRLVQSGGGEVVELHPIKARLEDYFMREQARHEEVPRGDVA